MTKPAPQFVLTPDARAEAVELGFNNLGSMLGVLEQIDSRLTRAGYVLTVAPVGISGPITSESFEISRDELQTVEEAARARLGRS